MKQFRFRLGAAVMMSVSLTVGTGIGTQKPSVADDKVVAWVQSRVRKLQPTKTDRRFDEIGWTRSIVQAETLARKHGRPVFLFTHDGQIATGRC